MGELKISEGLFHIISHTDLDGVVSAAIAWYAKRPSKRPVRVSLVGYGDVDNLILETGRSGVEMAVLDLSPQFQATVDEIDRGFEPGSRPFLFDHHQTTYEKYRNRPWIVVDMNCCGALGYWNWLHDGNADDEVLESVEPLRALVRIANDRDLWINEEPDGRLWQAMVTLCGEWGAFARILSNPGAAFTPAERNVVVDFVDRQEARFVRAKEALQRDRLAGGDEVAFLGDGHLEFGDTSDFCGAILDRQDGAAGASQIVMVALAYRRPNGNWAVSLRSRSGLAGNVVSLLKDGKKVRGGGHGDAAALYFPPTYREEGIRESIAAALRANAERSVDMGVTLGDLLKGAR